MIIFLRGLWRENIVRAVVTLFIGALIGEVLDAISIPEMTIPMWIFVGFSSVAFLILALAFLALQNSTRSLIERSGISFDVVQEEVTGGGVISGKVYSRLAELAINAEHEILVFNYPRVARVQSLQSDDPKVVLSKQRRLEWLAAELETLHRRRHTKFKYVMIIQIPDETASLTDMVDSDIAHSLSEMFSLQRENQNASYVIDIRRSHTGFVNPFVIVDGRYLTIPLYAVREGIMYIDKILVFEDREGQLVANFKTYFEQMERQASRITADDLLIQK